MNYLKALGFLIAGNVNWLLDTPDPDLGVPACCTDKCGPCSALLYLKEHSSFTVNVALQQLGHRYGWQLEDGSMDWSQLEAAWQAGRELGCSRIAGVKDCCDS